MADISIEHYRKQFFRESAELIDNIYDDILKAEAEPDNYDILNSLFRGVHTIKGSAGSFGLDEISSFVHHLENLLNLLREGRIDLTPDITDIILAGIDHISDMIQAGSSGTDMDRDLELEAGIIEKLESFCKSAVPACEQFCVQGEILPGSQVTNLEDTGLSEEIQAKLADTAARGLNIYRISLCYTSGHMGNGYDPFIFLKNLYNCCDYYYVVNYCNNGFSQVPPLPDFEPLNLYLKPTVCVGTNLLSEDIYDLTIDPSLIFIEQIKTANLSVKILTLSESADPESVNEFIIGTSEMLESAETAIMEYEATGSESALNEIFRVVHNIKGDADFIGLQCMTRFAHTLESLLEKLRTGFKIKKGAGDILLGSIDFFWKNIKKIDKGIEITDFPPVYETIKNLLESDSQESDSKKSGSNDSNQDDSDQENPVKEPQALLDDLDLDLKKVFFDQLIQYKTILNSKLQGLPFSDLKSGIRFKQAVLRALNGLSNASKVVNLTPLQRLSDKAAKAVSFMDSDLMPSELDDVVKYIENIGLGPKKIGEILIQNGKISHQDLAFGLARQKPLGEILLEAGRISQEDIKEALLTQKLMENYEQRHAKPVDREIRTMRVDESKIENLTNMAGELLIARNTYDYILNNLKKTGNTDIELYKALKENLYLFTHLTNDVHHGIMSMRMLPVGVVFRKYARIVRDISRKQKKSIELVIQGEDIEIDKKAAEVLAEPMMHLVRNACDHGIESVPERLSLGKSEKGTLIMKASHEGSSLCITVKDDGRGIDRHKLREKTKMTEMQASEHELLNMIFLPGISTRSQATDLSGRGVGMDVVKTAVNSLGGNVQVASTEKQGTEFNIFIPMTMGIDEVLLIELGKGIYAIPISYILETLKIPFSKIQWFTDKMFLHYRGEVINLEKLETLLHGNNSGIKNKSAVFDKEDKEISVVVIRTVRGRFGVIVDRLDKNMELAIKPVPKQLACLDIASGVSIMGNGRIIIVLNPDKL
ncbi:Two component system histidine kinase, CheA-like [Desulfonema limicola]|uniref:Chemotaxis protein CheA n=1 Tax=Desulfonema limicola TaxID=45656 RepID=A0A975B378_9BACT|nr:chemotaxis protein CheA [Desulfonema limicola]QTA77948.1 Two component system histidine kinase, CheA-like [Desulfonema limicola]